MAVTSINLLLEASYLDLEAVWINIGPNGKKIEYITKLFDFNENLIPFNIIGIGYTAEGQENKFIDKIMKIEYIMEKY